jgi:NADPH:quinone reductase
MRAIRLHAFGPPDHLVLDELPDLDPGDGEVRIAVEASGVHLLDTTIRRGEEGPLPLPELPTVPGREVAGVVDGVGPDVDPRWLGRRVVAHLGPVPGGYAEQALTSVERLFRVEDHVGFPDAVAAVGTGRTALGVVELEPAGAGDVVLVPSAAGGLGWLLVQASLAAGATVVAAARGARTTALAALGADLVVDYDRPDWARAVEEELGGVTLVYDGVGGAVGRAALELLRPGGRLVMFGYSAGSPTELTTSDLLARGLSAGWSLGARMNALPGGIPGLAGRALDKVAGGQWRPLVTTYPLAEAARAHADLEARRALGKVVLVTGGR